MNKLKILLAGSGWGAMAAYRSLARGAFLETYVFSDDKKILDFFSEENKVCSFEGEYDLIICAGWVKQIPLSIIEKSKIINIHYSLLPKFRGLHSVVWAILNNEYELGFTIHEMNEFFDDGDILYQYRILNDFKASSTWYMEHFNSQVEKDLLDIALKYINDDIKPYQQDKNLASWVGKRNHKDCLIDFKEDIQYQKAFFRALVSPYPVPYFLFREKIYEVVNCTFHLSDVISHYGRVLNVDTDGLWVSCKGGYLIFKEIRDFETKLPISISKFKVGVFFND